MKRVLLMAPIRTRSGYGERSRDIAESILSSPDYLLEIIGTRWGNTAWNGLDETTEIGKRIASCITKTPTPNPDIFIQITIPSEFHPRGKYNIGITAGIETTLCAPNWIEGCNRMDMVLGSSIHSIAVLKESVFELKNEATQQKVGDLKLKETVKTGVLFEGYREDVFKRKSVESVNQSMLDIKETFCYLFVGHWLDGPHGEDRKDVGMLVHTFCEAFKNKASKNKPALILKTSGGMASRLDKKNIEKKINHITSKIQGAPSVYLLYGDLTDEEMAGLYFHPKIKAMVSFTKGEGFGRPLLEFSTTGKPIIASGWSGQLTFLHPNYNILLPGGLKEVHPKVHNDWLVKGSKWFTVDYMFALRAFKDSYNKYKELSELSKQQRSHVKKNFTHAKMTELLLNILGSVEVAQEVQIKIPTLKVPKSQIKIPKVKVNS